MKMHYAKVAVFVDDEICQRDTCGLVSLLTEKVRVECEYVEREFGIAVRVLWNSLTDATHTLGEEEVKAIQRLFGRKGDPSGEA